MSEINLHPWEGTVIALKPSAKSGWWADVQRDDGLVWSVTVDLLEGVRDGEA